MNNHKLYVKRKFDFEIGHLVKSPCRDCPTHYQFPRCIHSCEILDRIQTQLAQGISSTRSHSPSDPFRLQLEDQHRK